MTSKLILSVIVSAALALGGWPERVFCGQQTAVEELRSAVDAMDGWLGPGRNGQRWHRFLKLPLLRQEMASEEVADAAVVRDVLSRFSQSEPGLEMSKFAAVRRAIQVWLDELEPASDADVAAAIKNAKQQFELVTPEDAQAAKAEFRHLAQRLDQYLGTGENGLAWKRYLRWEELSAELDDGRRPDVDMLEAVHGRLASGHEGLDLPVFADVRKALRLYVQRVWAASGDDPRAVYVRRLDQLTESLEATREEAKREDLRRLGLVLGWLQRCGYNRELVGTIRRQHSRPNLLVQVSGELLGAGLVESIDETQPITDLILGTSISGVGRTQGAIHIELVPSSDHATFDVIFEGAIRTRIVGSNGPARIGSSGVTRIAARKRLTFDAEGLSATSTRSSAVTNTITTGIWSTRCGMVDRIVRRVASRRLAKDKSLGERIAANHAEEQFNDRMDERVASLVAEGNQNFLDKFRRPLMERGEFPRLLRFHTTGDFLHLTVLQANRAQLGALDAPPPLVGDVDLAVRIHESLLNNFAFALLAGKTIKEDEFLEDMESLFGSVPERFRPKEDAEPWMITFQRDVPIVVQFEDGVISITIRGWRYASGDKVVRRAFDVTAAYQLVKTDAGLKAIRPDELKVFPAGFVPGERNLSLREQNWRELLQRRFEQVFEKELSVEHLTLPGRWEDAGELLPVQVECDNGWLVLSWRLARPADAANVAHARRKAEPLATASAEQ